MVCDVVFAYFAYLLLREEAVTALEEESKKALKDAASAKEEKKEKVTKPSLAGGNVSHLSPPKPKLLKHQSMNMGRKPHDASSPTRPKPSEKKTTVVAIGKKEVPAKSPKK